MLIKTLKYTFTGLTFGCVASDTIYNKVDRNVITPIWNFVEVMNDTDSFFVKEDLSKFTKELGSGLFNMFKFERGL